MRTSRSLLAALITTTACAALVVPTTAALAAQGHGGSALTAFGFAQASSGHDDGESDEDAVGDDDSADDGGVDATDTATTSADIALATHARVRLTTFDAARVTWRYGEGAEPEEVFVRLVPEDGAAIGATVDGSEHAVELAGLKASTRYRLTIASIASDGSSPTPVHTDGVRTPSEKAAVRAARKAEKRAAHAAKVALKLAARAAKRVRSADESEHADAVAAAADAREHADRAGTKARTAHAAAERARHRAAESESEDD